jgi:hypothetical protein
MALNQGIKEDSSFNRSLQRSKVGSDFKTRNISIVDVDTAILSYLESKNIHVITNDTRVNVPIIYGSPERWLQATKNGYIKDQKGQVQIPLIIFRRNSLERRSELINRFNRNQRVSYTTGYSNKNRFDKFSQQIDFKPTQEIYKVRIGDFVQMSYEFIIWTEFVSHTNQLIEQLNWNSDEYWGVDGGPKFKSSIESFGTSTELSSGQDRLVRTTFTLDVKAYLLPEIIDDGDDEQVIKSYTTQKVVLFNEIETELTEVTTQQELDTLLSADKSFNRVNQIGALTEVTVPLSVRTDIGFEEVAYYLSITNTRSATVTSSDTAVALNTTLATPPSVDYIDLSEETKFIVAINGTYITADNYSFVDNGSNITLTFDTDSLGYELNGSDTIKLVGKFVTP